MLRSFGLRGERRRAADLLCARITERAREPVFFTDFAVADTIDGRFDLVALHAWLVLDWLKTKGEPALAQALVDALFARFEDALRDQGTGDMGMNRRMKRLAGAFYGRISAYCDAGDETGLAGAIWRNLYRGGQSRVEPAAELAKYVVEARARLANIRPQSGEPDFGVVPVRAGPKP
jgi:cytochrome b pre-mRNA-processing protein 3